MTGTAPPPPPASTLPPGLADNPDYQVTRELGRGGMGVVYLAENTLMGRPEVLKVVGSDLIRRPGVLDRFLREIRSAAKLHHTNIVTAYSALRIGESLVLAMEYVEGLDLARLVKTKGPLPVAHACNFIYQAALGLQHAHENGMVHRDIKPANLIFTRMGKKPIVKVLDFGLAKVTSEGQADRSLTCEGQMLGTPDYIAPEQIRDAQSADIRADIYSLGCTFYYLLTGGPPFGGENLWDLYQAHFSMDANPLNLIRPEVPVELAALVGKMMAKEPARRFQTPGEVAQALVPFFSKGTPGSSKSRVETRPTGQSAVHQEWPGAASARTRTATERAPVPPPLPRDPTPTTPERPARTRPPVPPPLPRDPVPPLRSGTILDGLIDLNEKDPLFDAMLDRTPPVAATPLSRRAHRTWSTAMARLGWLGSRTRWTAAGVLLLGLIVAGALAMVIRITTRDGRIVLENVPEQAQVFVDGEKVTVQWPGGGGPVEITVPAGRHGIQVRQDGFLTFGEEVTVQSGEKSDLRVRLAGAGTPGKNDEAKGSASGPPNGGQGGAAARQKGPRFTSLFNGKDTTGWTDVMPNGSEWTVDDRGVLVGRNGGPGNFAVLVTERQDFTNFRLRVKYRFQEDGVGWIDIRRSTSGEAVNAYRVKLGIWPTADRWQVPIGSITRLNDYHYGPGFGWDQKAETMPVPIDQWNTLEIQAVGNRITTSLNETVVASYTDDWSSYGSGAIALNARQDSIVQFQDIRIEELTENGAPRAPVQGEATELKGAATEGANPKPPRSVVGKWQHEWGFHDPPSQSKIITLTADGSIHNGGVEEGTWSMEGSTLILRWPFPEAPEAPGSIAWSFPRNGTGMRARIRNINSSAASESRSEE